MHCTYISFPFFVVCRCWESEMHSGVCRFIFCRYCDGFQCCDGFRFSSKNIKPDTLCFQFEKVRCTAEFVDFLILRFFLDAVTISGLAPKI